MNGSSPRCSTGAARIAYAVKVIAKGYAVVGIVGSRGIVKKQSRLRLFLKGLRISRVRHPDVDTATASPPGHVHRIIAQYGIRADAIVEIGQVVRTAILPGHFADHLMAGA